uniref:G-protein coupled receptors family 1 profile domain-containing protein n=1 Tax=Anopheles farauti TaxID=69004 RepID=A0A182QHS1_9DIPT
MPTALRGSETHREATVKRPSETSPDVHDCDSSEQSTTFDRGGLPEQCVAAVLISPQSVNTAIVPACPPSSRGGPRVGCVGVCAGQAHTQQDDHVLRSAGCGHVRVAAVWPGWPRRSTPDARQLNATVQYGRCDVREHVASPGSGTAIAWSNDGWRGGGGGVGGGRTNKPNTTGTATATATRARTSTWTTQRRHRTKRRFVATAVGVATVILGVLSHLILTTVAYSVDGETSGSNATNAGNGNALSNRFGRLLLNGTRTAATITTTTTTTSSTTSSTNHHTASDQSPFDGAEAEFVAADGTASAGFNDSSEMPQIPEYIRATSMVFCIIIMCLGVIGNIMVPIVILKTKDMRNSTNIFLTNLSIADLLVLLVCTPTVLVEVNSPPEVWVLGEEMYGYGHHQDLDIPYRNRTADHRPYVGPRTWLTIARVVLAMPCYLSSPIVDRAAHLLPSNVAIKRASLRWGQCDRILVTLSTQTRQHSIGRCCPGMFVRKWKKH